MNLRHSLLAALVAVLWGLNFVAIDFGLHANGREVPPLLFVAMRFVLVVFPWIFFIRKPDISWKAIIGVGLFMSAGQFGLLYLAMALGMPAGLASSSCRRRCCSPCSWPPGSWGSGPAAASWPASSLASRDWPWWPWAEAPSPRCCRSLSFLELRCPGPPGMSSPARPKPPRGWGWWSGPAPWCRCPCRPVAAGGRSGRRAWHAG